MKLCGTCPQTHINLFTCNLLGLFLSPLRARVIHIKLVYNEILWGPYNIIALHLEQLLSSSHYLVHCLTQGKHCSHSHLRMYTCNAHTQCTHSNNKTKLVICVNNIFIHTHITT